MFPNHTAVTAAPRVTTRVVAPVVGACLIARSGASALARMGESERLHRRVSKMVGVE